MRTNLTLNLGLRYEMTTRPTDANTVPGYTVNGYTVPAAGFQEIISLTNCTPGTTACGPIGVNSPLQSNPTTKNFEPRIGFAYDPFNDGRTAIRGAFGMFDVLPLPYEFGLNTAATAPFQIIGTDPNAQLGTGISIPMSASTARRFATGSSTRIPSAPSDELEPEYAAAIWKDLDRQCWVCRFTQSSISRLRRMTSTWFNRLRYRVWDMFSPAIRPQLAARQHMRESGRQGHGSIPTGAAAQVSVRCCSTALPPIAACKRS